ncbi:MAG: MarR family winged helix-turn-helix transcriptional regulator [Clostridiaceae bacterium]
MSYDRTIGAFTNLTNRNIAKYLTSHLEEYNITLEQWGVLVRLCEENGLTQKELSQRVSKDQPTLTRILDLMVKKEMVKRAANEKDRRAFNIYITDKGRELKEKLFPIIESLFEKILVDISQEDLEIYLKVLSKINENIKNQD